MIKICTLFVKTSPSQQWFRARSSLCTALFGAAQLQRPPTKTQVRNSVIVCQVIRERTRSIAGFRVPFVRSEPPTRLSTAFSSRRASETANKHKSRIHTIAFQPCGIFQWQDSEFNQVRKTRRNFGPSRPRVESGPDRCSTGFDLSDSKSISTQSSGRIGHFEKRCVRSDQDSQNSGAEIGERTINAFIFELLMTF